MDANRGSHKIATANPAGMRIGGSIPLGCVDRRHRVENGRAGLGSGGRFFLGNRQCSKVVNELLGPAPVWCAARGDYRDLGRLAPGNQGFALNPASMEPLTDRALREVVRPELCGLHRPGDPARLSSREPTTAAQRGPQ